LADTYQEVIDMQDHTTQEIPHGYCHCGCGQRTNLARTTDKVKGWTRGEPLRYIYGHKGKENMARENPNPSGLCMCGCGKPTQLADASRPKKGHVPGQPVRFLPGHASKLREQKPPVERYWAKVVKRGPDECWDWSGSKEVHGYGQLRIKGRSTKAHRFSYELHFGPIPNGLDCLHKCDNPPCTNPNHLFLGTAKDNADDMNAKGRGSKPPIQHMKGETHPLAQFTNAQVREFREQFALVDTSIRQFALLHNISPKTMRKILRNITYQSA
jgi:hypothetical protein